MSRKGSRWFFEDALQCCIVTMFSKGFGGHSSMRQVLLILKLVANVTRIKSFIIVVTQTLKMMHICVTRQP